MHWQVALTTEQLLLDRALGVARAEDYIDWAVDRMAKGADTPNLRILAGLSPRFDRHDVEYYFKRACYDLDLEPPSVNSPRAAARITCQLFRKGTFSPAEAVRRIDRLYRPLADSSDAWLAPWFYLAEDLSLLGSGYGTAFFASEVVENLEETVTQECRILDLAHALTEPAARVYDDVVSRWVRCEECGTVGDPQLRRRSLVWQLEARLRGGLPNLEWPHCRACGSREVSRAGLDPDVREEWLASQLEGDPRREEVDENRGL